MHENQAYLQKKDEKMVSIASEVLQQTYFKLQLLTSQLKTKITFEMLQQKRKALFNRWKRVTFLQQLAGDMFEDKENASSFTYTHTHHILTAQSNLLSQQPLGTHLLSGVELGRSYEAYQNLKLQELVYSKLPKQRPNLAPNKGQQRDQAILELGMKQVKVSQQVQAVARLQQYQFTRSEQKRMKTQAFNNWKYKVEAQRIVETAFDQMLDCHQRHQEQRFSTACALLSRLDKVAS